MESEERLTIKEVAKKLDVAEGEVMNMFIHGINDAGPTLQPSVYLEKPVTLLNLTQYRKDFDDEKLNPLDQSLCKVNMSGLFKIKDYIRSSRKLDSNSKFLDLTIIPLLRGDDEFLVVDSCTLLKSKLTVAKKDFENFIAFYNFVGHENVPSETPQTPEDYSIYLKNKGKPEAVIAALLRTKFSQKKLNGYEILKLIFPNEAGLFEHAKTKPEQKKLDARRRQRASILIKKGFEILKKEKK